MFALYMLPKIVKSVIGVFLINIILIEIFWLISKRRELSIKKSLGATNIDIILDIVMHQVAIIIIAYIIAISIHYIIVTYTNFGVIDYIGVHVDVVKTLKILLYGVIISLVLNVGMMRKINKIEPSMSMKGR